MTNIYIYRVFRTPGGVSSDLFGSELPQTPRNVKNRMASNIFSAEKDALKNTGKLNLLQHKFVLERFSAFAKIGFLRLTLLQKKLFYLLIQNYCINI